MNSSTTLFFALMCVGARSSLNIIDRKVFGHNRASFFQTQFINALISTLFCATLAFAISRKPLTLQEILNLKTFLIALIMYLSSLAFSAAFRSKGIQLIAFAAKLADVIIPITFLVMQLPVTRSSLILQLLSALVIFPLLFSQRANLKEYISPEILFLIASLAFQAVAVFKIGGKSANQDFGAFLYGVTGVFIWRVVFAVIPLLHKNKILALSCSDILKPILLFRAILMLINYIGFLKAISGPESGLAWALFNSTGLLTIVLAPFFLNERSSRRELLAFSVILILSVTFSFAGGK